MKKLVKDFTYKDLQDYGNYRACDGQWDLMLAMTYIDFYRSIPKPLFNRKKKQNEYVKKHIHEVFNLETYPNMKIDVETGEVEI